MCISPFSLNLAGKTQIKSVMESNFSGFDFEINFKSQS